jgi:hypothetical protein
MDRNLRLLWAYDHPTTRYQEVNLFTDAGMEVVVSLGDLGAQRFDRDYHDETHPLYPDWRSSLTLPASVVERLRRISLVAREGRVDPDDATLINRYVDVIVIPADPAVVDNIMAWFGGHLLWRVMGAPDYNQLLAKLDELEEVARRHPGRLRLSPGLKSMIPHAAPTLRSDFVYMNAWVSPERMHHFWAGADSRPVVTSAISYIEKYPVFAGQFRNLRNSLQSRSLEVVGKNDKRAAACSDPSIIGPLSTQALHRTIATSRLFVDASVTPEHLIWPPLEAMSMGVPVLFARWSALTAAALDDGYSEAALADAGMLADFEAIDRFISPSFDDIPLLEAIAERQRAIFLQGCFARDKAMLNFVRFAKEVTAGRLRQTDALTPEAIVEDGARLRRRAGEPPIQRSISQLDGNTLARLGVLIRPSQVTADTGRLLADTTGHEVRRVREGKEGAGFLIKDFMPDLDPGAYRLRVAFVVRKGSGIVAKLAVGGFFPDGYREEGSEIRVSGPGHVEAEIGFAISPTDFGTAREVRLHWYGAGDIEFQWLRLRPEGAKA